MCMRICDWRTSDLILTTPIPCILYSWDHASLDMEILYLTNKMQLVMIFIINNALHVLGIYRPSSGTYELYVQLMVQVS
jgi:hypothetical protein